MNIHELMQNTELIKILNEIYITGRQTRAAPYNQIERMSQSVGDGVPDVPNTRTNGAYNVDNRII